MSTRCNIIVRQGGADVCTLYHHCDGYPEGVGLDLLGLVEGFFEQNKFYTVWACDVVNRLIKNTYDEGYEWTDSIHGDIEYLYTIDLDKKKVFCESIYTKEQIDLYALRDENGRN